MCGHSRSIGSFTFMIMSAVAPHGRGVGRDRRADGRVVLVAESRCPSPAPVSMSTEWPAATSASAPAGTSAMRFSFVLISFGTPIFMGSCSSSVSGR